MGPRKTTITGQELRAIRQELGMTQAAIARELEISSNTWALWEREVKPPLTPRMLIMALMWLRSRRRRRSDED